MKKNFTWSLTLLFFLVLSTFKLVSQESWTPKKTFPGPERFQSVSFVIGNYFYMGLGSNDGGYLSDFWKYDVVNDQWTQLPDFPGGARNSASGFSVGNKGFVCFGSNSSNEMNWLWYKDVWEYDPGAPEALAWTRKNDFPGHERYLALAFTIGNKGYIGAGSYRFARWTISDYYNDFWEYDPALDHWTQKPNIPEEGRNAGTGISIGNKGYVGFGFYYYDTRKKDWWEYDPAAPESSAWTRKAEFPGEPRYHASGFSFHTKGYIVGGANYSPFNDLWEYNPSTDQWKQKTNFPGDPRYSVVTATIGNRAFLGMGVWAVYYKDFWEYSDDVTITCPPDATVYATWNQGCGQFVPGIEPIFTPLDANPRLNWTHIWRGSIIRTGEGVPTNTTFPVRDNILIYSLPDYAGQTCSLRITVLDTLTPRLTPPPTQKFCYNPSNQYRIPYLQFSDNCDIIADISQGAFIGYTVTGATNRSGLWPDASGSFNPGTSIINWKVKDPSGNEGTAQTTVIIDQPLSVNIPNSYSALFGDPNTVYIGYGLEGLLLTAMPQGGTRFSNNNYMYSWSNGASSRSIWVSPSAVGTYTYSVSITDSLGCTATDNISVTVKDVRCGPQMNRVIVCSNTRQGFRELCLKPADAFVALLFGAKLGNCNQPITLAGSGRNGSIMEQNKEASIQAYPNPNKGSFHLVMNNFSAGQYEINVMDISGRTVKQERVYVSVSNCVMPVHLPATAKGIYLVRVNANNKTVFTQKLIVE
jgi:N-acetylneuraminic acid mutarotase